MKTFLTIILFLPLPAVFAQKNSLWISSGYNYGNNKSSHITDMTWGKSRNYSLGNGTATQLFFQHQPDSSNWISGAGLHMMIGNRNPARIDERTNDTVKSATLTSNSLRLFLQLGYVWQIKKLNFQLNAGLLLPLSTRLEQETNYHDSSVVTTETAIIKNYFSIGFKSSLACSYKLHQHINLFLMIDYNLLNPYVKSKTIKQYESSNGQQLEDVYKNTSDREFIYYKHAEDIHNNKDVLPSAFDKSKPTDRLSYSQSYSSLGFQIGFQFLF